MAAEAKIQVAIDGDARGAKRAMQEATDAARKMSAEVSASSTSAASAVEAIGKAAGGLRAAVGMIGGTIAAATAAIAVGRRLYQSWRDAGKAADELAASAKRAADAASAAGLDLSLYDAVREAAERAGVPVEELNKKLAEFAQHKLTFQELAESVRATGDAIQQAASRADAGNVGTRYLAERAKADADAAAARSARETEQAGLREIVRGIARGSNAIGGGNSYVDALWDRLLEAAGGSAERAGELYNANRTYWNTAQFGVFRSGGGVAGAYGVQAAEEAAARWRQRREEAEARRRAEIEARDRETAAQREREAQAAREKAEAEAAREAERKAAEERRAAEAAARLAQQLDALAERREETARAREEAIDAVTVRAPTGANALASAGGLLGADMAQRNIERMDAERNAKIDMLNQKFERAIEKIDQQIDILKGG